MKEQIQVPDLRGVYSHEAHSIEVSVLPMHLERESSPERGIFAFTYSVTITNTGMEAVQLLERYWLVKSGGRQIAEVVGPGVVGVKPVLDPQSAFQYSSTVIIRDAEGSMEGSYTFRSESGSFFDVSIPRFELSYPVIIH